MITIVVASVGTAMYYRLCILDRDGQIGCTVIFDCPHDDAAKQVAARMLDDNDVEVWQGSRKVAVLHAKAYAKRYRLHLYDADGRLISPGMIITTDSDDAAISEAKKRVGNFGAELWAGDHVIKEFAPKR